MVLPSSREIRTQLFIVVGFATLAFSATTFFMETRRPNALVSRASVSVSAQDAMQGSGPGNWPGNWPVSLPANWDDVNLMTGDVESPEATVNTARSKMLGDFEAR